MSLLLALQARGRGFEPRWLHCFKTLYCKKLRRPPVGISDWGSTCFSTCWGCIPAGIDLGTLRWGGIGTHGVKMRCWRSRLREVFPGGLVPPPGVYCGRRRMSADVGGFSHRPTSGRLKKLSFSLVNLDELPGRRPAGNVDRHQ